MTAEEIIPNTSARFTREQVIELAIKFAKYHVQEALKKASEDGEVEEYYPNPYTSETRMIVNKDSILNAYDLNQIK